MNMYSTAPIIIIVSGPSGSGKKTLIDHIVQSFPEIERVPTFTTRCPRAGEVPGVDYIYISQKEFDNYINNGYIFEYTKTYKDSYYGSPKKFIEYDDDNSNIITELDYKGMFRVRSVSKRNVISIFIVPPGITELSKRIEIRSVEKNIRQRLNLVSEQMQFAWAYDYILFNIDKKQFLCHAECIVKTELIKRNNLLKLLSDRHIYDNTL